MFKRKRARSFGKRVSIRKAATVHGKRTERKEGKRIVDLTKTKPQTFKKKSKRIIQTQRTVYDDFVIKRRCSVRINRAKLHKPTLVERNLNIKKEKRKTFSNIVDHKDGIFRLDKPVKKGLRLFDKSKFIKKEKRKGLRLMGYNANSHIAESPKRNISRKMNYEIQCVNEKPKVERKKRITQSTQINDSPFFSRKKRIHDLNNKTSLMNYLSDPTLKYKAVYPCTKDYVHSCTRSSVTYDILTLKN